MAPTFGLAGIIKASRSRGNGPGSADRNRRRNLFLPAATASGGTQSSQPALGNSRIISARQYHERTHPRPQRSIHAAISTRNSDHDSHVRKLTRSRNERASELVITNTRRCRQAAGRQKDPHPEDS